MADKAFGGENSRSGVSEEIRDENNHLENTERENSENNNYTLSLLEIVKKITVYCTENYYKDNFIKLLFVLLKSIVFENDYNSYELLSESKSTYQKYVVSRVEIKKKKYGIVKYEELRKFLLHYYLKLRSLTSLYHIYSKVIHKHLTTANIKLNLEKHGFIFKRYPGTNRHFIVENPEHVLERVRYIKRMQYYRQINRNIVYVETIKDNLILAVAPVIWSFTMNYPKSDVISLELSVKNHLIPNLPINSVVVLSKDFRRNLTTMPNEYSSKRNMIDWLQQNGLPGDENMHKAELFKLVKTFRNITREKYYLEEVLAGYGHTVIWKPEFSNSYTYDGVLEKIYSKLKNDAVTFMSVIKEIPINMWKEYDYYIASEENKVLEEDTLLTEVLDAIIISAKNKTHQISGLSHCISNAKDEFIRNVIVE